MLRKGLSEWTNKFIEICDEIAGRKLTDSEILLVMDYCIGFLCEKEDTRDYADQALLHLDIIK